LKNLAKPGQERKHEAQRTRMERADKFQKKSSRRRSGGESSQDFRGKVGRSKHKLVTSEQNERAHGLRNVVSEGVLGLANHLTDLQSVE